MSSSAANTASAAANFAKRTVEKMGRKWGGVGNMVQNMGMTIGGMGMSSSSSGSGYSSSASSGKDATSSFSSSVGDYGLARTHSGGSVSVSGSGSGKQGHGHGHAIHTFIPSPSKSRQKSGHAHKSSVSSTTSDSSDPFGAPQGPTLGRLLRGPRAASKVVFGRDLKSVVRDTRVGVASSGSSSLREAGGGTKRVSILSDLEERLLPAVVVRCAQHLLIWGVQEEGLFRVSGRPAHVSLLRKEFDSGVDYDMMECTPGDLDPHAVASVFKAFLRERTSFLFGEIWLGSDMRLLFSP